MGDPISKHRTRGDEPAVHGEHDVAGVEPELSTTGGTSDARFISRYCPVLEFGLVGESMHKVDEKSAIADLKTLARVYETVLDRYFAA